MAVEGSYSYWSNISSILATGKNTLGIIMFNGRFFTGEEKNLPLICVKSNFKKIICKWR